MASHSVPYQPVAREEHGVALLAADVATAKHDEERPQRLDGAAFEPVLEWAGPGSVATLPVQQSKAEVFSTSWATFSVLTLAILFGLSVWGLWRFHTWYVRAFMVVSCIPAFLGMSFESIMLAVGSAYQPANIKFWGPAIKTQRTATSILVGLAEPLVFLAVMLPDSTIRSAISHVVLGVAAFTYISSVASDTHRKPLPGISALVAGFAGLAYLLDLSLIAYGWWQQAHDLHTGCPAAGGFVRSAYGSWAASILVSMAASVLAVRTGGLSTPRASVAFHIFAIVARGANLWALVQCDGSLPPAAPLGTISAASALLLGLVLPVLLSRHVANAVRSTASCAVWWAMHRLLFVPTSYAYCSCKGVDYSLPRPLGLESTNERPIQLVPYSTAHTRNVTLPLNLPAADHIPSWAKYDTELLVPMFKLFSWLDRWLPTARVSRGAEDDETRVQMPMDATPPDAVPPQLFHLGNGGGWEVPNDEFFVAHEHGQLLAFLATYGGTNCRLKSEGQEVVLDFLHLDRLKVKPSNLTYGGKAWFEWRNLGGKFPHLFLTKLQGPNQPKPMEVDPKSREFRMAEAQLLQTLALDEVAGRHLVGLHVMNSLVPVALHNAFHVKGRQSHPVCVWLHPHFYSHMAVNELSVTHLLEDGAVFCQIWGLTQPSLYEYLELASKDDFHHDCDLDRRKQAHGGRVLPCTRLEWDLEYYQIFYRYCSALVSSHYRSDEDVAADQDLANFVVETGPLLSEASQQRYEKLRSVRGLTSFLTDAMFRAIVIHEVIGTRFTWSGMDGRLNQLQVKAGPDGGMLPQLWEEYMSSVYITLATGRVERPKLLGADIEYIFEVLPVQEAGSAKEAWRQLQGDLRKLSSEMQRDQFLNSLGRILPENLEFGALY